MTPAQRLAQRLRLAVFRLRAGRPRRSCGFTLVELLIALTLVGLLTVALFGGLRFGTRAWEAGNRQAEILAETEAVQGLLRRLLSQVILPRPAEGGALAAEAMEGTADGLRFVSVLPSHIGVGGLYIFNLSLADDEDTARLDLAWRLYRPDDPEPFVSGEDQDRQRRALIEGIENAVISYYGVRQGDQDADWHDDWFGTAGPPALVSIKIEFAETDRRSWPALVVAPRFRER
jgi:general secretion pathway protein J